MEGAPSTPRDLMVKTKLQYLLKQKDNMIILRSEDTVEAALQAMASLKLMSAPVVEPLKGQPVNSVGQEIIGFLDIRDIFMTFLKEVGPHELSEARLLARMPLLESRGRAFSKRKIKELPAAHWGWDGSFTLHTGGIRMSVHELVHNSFLYPKSQTKGMHGGANSRAIVHRIALHDKDMRITHIITQSDIVRYVYKNKHSLGELASRTVEQLGWTGVDVLTVPSTKPAFEVLQILSQKEYTAVGVVDECGMLIGNFSITDLRSLGPQHFGALALPVAEFLALKNGTEFSGNAEAQVSSSLDSKSWRSSFKLDDDLQGTHGKLQAQPGFPVGQQLITAAPSDTFCQVLDKLVPAHLHRIYVLDSQQKPIGITTLTDILKVITDETMRA